jgi:hypothetical protein
MYSGFDGVGHPGVPVAVRVLDDQGGAAAAHVKGPFGLWAEDVDDGAGAVGCDDLVADVHSLPSSGPNGTRRSHRFFIEQ